MTHPPRTIDTAAVHAGSPDPNIDGAVVTPIFQSVNFLHEGTASYHATRYVRLSNAPNHHVLADKLATLEGAEAAIVTASGMAAISTALLTVLGSGDHLLMIDSPYGGTRNLVTTTLPRLGIETTFIDGNDASSWKAALRPTTRAIYVESITNPLMQVPDLPGVAAFARGHGLVSLIDNTIPSPVNFRPIAIGFDLSLHSATKALAGHSDVAAGAVIGSAETIRRVDHLLSHLGGSLDPHACFLLERGIKTLALRVRRQTETAGVLADMLAQHPAVSAVHYPGLASTPGHDHARALFDGYGGVLSFELAGGVAAADRLVEHLSIPVHTVSLGGVETLIIRPATTAYADVPAEERRRLGVTDALLRLSVGIEDADELRADLEQGLERVASSAA
jgi:cystathionine beta-lyase/cystathionine gamma-synthase